MSLKYVITESSISILISDIIDIIPASDCRYKEIKKLLENEEPEHTVLEYIYGDIVFNAKKLLRGQSAK